MEEKKGFGDIYNSTGNADDVETDVTEEVDSAEFVDQDNLNDYDNTAEAATEDVDDTFDEAAYEEKILYRNNFEYTTPLLKELYKGIRPEELIPFSFTVFLQQTLLPILYLQ